MAPLSVLIVGAGVAGPTLASFLLLAPTEEKPHVTLLERSSSLPAHGQNVDIRGTGATIMRKLGMETVIRASLTNEEGAQFVDEKNQIWAAFGADKSGEVQTGTSDLEILRGTLSKLCYRRSESISKELESWGGKGIEYILGDHLEEINQDDRKVHVRFAKSGERRDFDVVVGADGLQSWTRRMVFGDDGEPDRVKRLGMYAGFFSMPAGETDSKWRRWFHAPGRRGVMVRPGERDDMSTVLMSVINDNDTRLRQVVAKGHQGVEEQKALLKEYFQDAGWECGRFIREMEAADDFYYDMVAQVKMSDSGWSKGRVVLLGDAGYCASPISGMGTTLALNGAYNLAGALMRHSNDYSAAFALYEEQMRPLVEKAQKLVPGAPHIFNPETAWGISALHIIMAFMCWTGVVNLVARFAGPPANVLPVEDYGFRELDEWEE